MNIGMLLFPRLTQLDLTGPFELLHRLPDTRVHLLWKDLQPVRSESGMVILPTTPLDDCPPLDVLFVPGGIGVRSLLTDDKILSFLGRQGANAKWVTSVCIGSLLLGAAGLLQGYQATTHWFYVDMLQSFGAHYVKGRVVVDRNRMTGGGVTAGIDFGLRLVAALAGEKLARALQLGLEYDPEPPFHCGHPDRADRELVEEVRAFMAERWARG
jgi:cyclohexyl-isocyanide hydratase